MPFTHCLSSPTDCSLSTKSSRGRTSSLKASANATSPSLGDDVAGVAVDEVDAVVDEAVDAFDDTMLPDLVVNGVRGVVLPFPCRNHTNQRFNEYWSIAYQTTIVGRSQTKHQLLVDRIPNNKCWSIALWKNNSKFVFHGVNTKEGVT